MKSPKDPEEHQFTEAELDNIITKFQDETRRSLLVFLNDKVMREQEIYWQRFTAFSALHAGAFVLLTAPHLPKNHIAKGGVILAVAWVLIQWVSLHYAHRPKALYDTLLKRLGIRFRSGVKI